MLVHSDDDDEQQVMMADIGVARNNGDISGLTTTT
jgi:hypothetical protein